MMKRFLIGWIVLTVLLVGLSVPALAQNDATTFTLFVSCKETTESGLTRIWFGYESSAFVEGVAYYGPSEGAGFIGYPPNTMYAGRLDKIFGIELQEPGVVAFYEFIANDGSSFHVEADANTKVQACKKIAYGPDGGLRTITKDVAPGCYEWSIEDDYGHWSTVATTCSQVEGDHVFVRLVLGRDNPITDESRYRVWQVEDDGHEVLAAAGGG